MRPTTLARLLLASLPAATPPLIAQQSAAARVELLSSTDARSCDEARGVEFDARLSTAQREIARALLKTRAELTALDQALTGVIQFRSGQPPITITRRGGRDSVSVTVLEQELERVLQGIDSTFRRAARVRARDGSETVVLDVNASAADLRRLVVRASDVMGAVATDLFGANRRPAGWLGVAITGEYLPRFSREGPGQWYCSDPVVESVVVGGPADRAGLARGDTLLTMNGQEMRGREVRFEPLLRPGTTITFRTRRGGKVRDVPVVVEKRPPSAVASGPLTTGTGFAFSSDSGAAMMTFGEGVARGARGARGGVTVSVYPDAGDANSREGDSRPARWSSDATASFIGGARFARLSPDLADALGVASGVLVSTVGVGSPAADAGLREGDVIFAVNGSTVTTPLQLLGHARQLRTLSLDVVRRGKTRTISFKF
jgi:membrane-associated protease RseP (regulator of RpoE activity)